MQSLSLGRFEIGVGSDLWCLGKGGDFGVDFRMRMGVCSPIVGLFSERLT